MTLVSRCNSYALGRFRLKQVHAEIFEVCQQQHINCDADNMPDQDCVSIRKQLARFPGTDLGFMIYRLTYKDDKEWARFMSYFARRTYQNLEDLGDEDLIPHISWHVHEDAAMEGAGAELVRA